MLIGYMRVSTGEQNLDLQRDALDRAVIPDLSVDAGPDGSASDWLLPLSASMSGVE